MTAIALKVPVNFGVHPLVIEDDGRMSVTFSTGIIDIVLADRADVIHELLSDTLAQVDAIRATTHPHPEEEPHGSR